MRPKATILINNSSYTTKTTPQRRKPTNFPRFPTETENFMGKFLLLLRSLWWWEIVEEKTLYLLTTLDIVMNTKNPEKNWKQI